MCFTSVPVRPLRALSALLVLLVLLGWEGASAQFALSIGGTAGDNVLGVAALPDGGVLATGYFTGSAEFAPNGPTSHVMTAQGQDDVFVARYDASGALVYALSVGSTDYDEANAIAALPDGSAYVTGRFEGTMEFDPLGPGSTVLTSADTDVFVAKYDPNGHLDFAFALGDTSTTEIDIGRGIAVMPDGGFAVTGSFRSSVDFNPLGATPVVRTSSGGTDAFVARYTADGQLVYALGLGGTGFENGYDVDFLPDGSVLATGTMNGTGEFNPLGTSATLTSNGGADAYLARYDPAGLLVYAFPLGGTATEEAQNVVATPDGGALISGSFRNTADFNPQGATPTELTSAGVSDGFTARYDSSGALVYALQIGGTGGDRVRAAAAFPDGGFAVTGGFSATVDFDPLSPGSTTHTSVGNADIFVARYAADGALTYVVATGSLSLDDGRAIDANALGGALVAGGFQNSFDFNPLGTTPVVLTSAGGTEGFIAQYDAQGRLGTTTGAATGPQGATAGLSAYPNPVRSSALLGFHLTEGGPVRLDVYDALGRRVARVVEGDFAAGDHEVRWATEGLANGVYVVRLEAEGRVATRRVSVQR